MLMTFCCCQPIFRMLVCNFDEIFFLILLNNNSPSVSSSHDGLREDNKANFLPEQASRQHYVTQRYSRYYYYSALGL